MKLTTDNPDQLEYSNNLMDFTVLGGIRLDGLDRMRVTLKVGLKGSACPPVRHNLDLYNDVQVEKFVRKTAERLETGTSLIAAGLNELTNELESYRLMMLEKTREDQYKPRELGEKEQIEAETFLKQPNLLSHTNELIGQSGVIGEELNRLLMYIIFTSRKREQPLHVVSLGSSGTGKTHLQEKVGGLMPEEDRIEITTLSENAFYYFGQRELKHKLILIEDLDGAENVLYPLRELQSKKRISKTIARKNSRGETRTMHLTVEGPVSVAGCTTREQIYEDNANRSFLIYVDESPEQDQQVMEYQRKLSAGKINTDEQEKTAELLRNCQRILKPVKVVNPFAELLRLPKEVFKPRRTNTHYLQFIEAVTFYHQYQREQEANHETGEIIIKTTIEDIAGANKLMKEILLHKSDELTGVCRNYFECLKDWLHEERKTEFTNFQARQALRENHSNQKRYMIQLQQQGYVQRTTGDKKKGYYYKITDMEEYQKLKQGIDNVLDDIFLNIQQEVQSSKEVHHPNEPLKRKITNKKLQEVQQP
ncbi:MAG: hypothetical protein A2W91_12880 [Bacteroidetes bacterium GWF2_38_335]|nr:MAG: hypothetical protein A2W91_12880 [Bacteroidetes bacterium GWF2_38_335]